MAGTVAGLVIVRRRSSVKGTRSRPVLSKTRPLSGAVRYHLIAKPVKANKNNRQKIPARPTRMRGPVASLNTSQATMVTMEAVTAAPFAPSFSSCPACGLEAPEGSMAEHFVQSPSHHLGPVPAPSMIRTPASETASESGEDDEPKLSFRNLLQMLVPPRAFGHRHQQRTVNPLSRMVQAIEVPRTVP